MSPSATTISANTIKDLLPFHAEFQSAGLAVTSCEQRRTNLPTKQNSYSPCVSQIADRLPKQVGGHDGPDSIASGSTGTTVIGFTPPHEKTYGLSTKDRARGSSTVSDFIAVGFTPHEKKTRYSASPSARPTARSPMRSSVVWASEAGSVPQSTSFST